MTEYPEFRVWLPLRNAFAYVEMLGLGSFNFTPDGAQNYHELYTHSLNMGTPGPLEQWTGHVDIDGVKVFDGDIVRMVEDKQDYIVRWDQLEGAWGIYYKNLNAFKIGMLSFMQVAGHIHKEATNAKEKS